MKKSTKVIGSVLAGVTATTIALGSHAFASADTQKATTETTSPVISAASTTGAPQSVVEAGEGMAAARLTCDQLIMPSRQPSFVKGQAWTKGWKIYCRSGLPDNNLGVTYPTERVIYVNRRGHRDELDMRNTIAHEWAHAEHLSTWNKPAQRLWRTKLGKNPRLYALGSDPEPHATQDIEVWARSRAFCAGYGANGAEGLILPFCPMINQQVADAAYLRRHLGMSAK